MQDADDEGRAEQSDGGSTSGEARDRLHGDERGAIVRHIVDESRLCASQPAEAQDRNDRERRWRMEWASVRMKGTEGPRERRRWQRRVLG